MAWILSSKFESCLVNIIKIKPTIKPFIALFCYITYSFNTLFAPWLGINISRSRLDEDRSKLWQTKTIYHQELFYNLKTKTKKNDRSLTTLVTDGQSICLRFYTGTHILSLVNRF